MAAPHVHPRSEAWARANLTRGSSGGQVWEISAQYPEARLTVGSDPSAGWPIAAHGVFPIHCELFWDGTALWVADTAQVGGVFLDGMRVSDWVQIQGPAELRFGGAAMDIETSVPAGQRMMASPQGAKPVTVTDFVMPAERASSPMFGGAAGDLSVPDLDAEKTRMAGIDDARTHHQLASPPEAPSMDLRPRLGGAVATAAAPSYGNEATRMVPMPGQSAPAAPQKIGTPLGSAMPPLVGVPLAGPPAPVVAPPPAAPRMPPPPPPSPPPIALPPEPMAPMPPPPGMDPGMGFAAPPPPATAPQEKKGNALGKVWEKLKPEKPQTDGKQAMPTRTWILLGVTVLVTVGWLLWDDTPEEVAAPTPPPVAAPAPTPPAPEPPPPVPPPVAPEPPPPVANDPTAPPVADVAPPPSSPPPTGSETGDEAPVGPTLQRQAADAYSSGDLASALTAYRELAAQQPADPAYPAMVRMLERRLAEQRER